MDIHVTAQLLGNFGEFIGAIVVVVTLFYLSVQVRRNTQALQLASSDSIAESILELNRMPIESAEVNAILMRGAVDPSSLDPEERSRFNGLANILIYNWQRSFYSHKARALETDIWEGQLVSIKTVLQSPGYRRRWDRISPSLGKGFVSFVQSEILPEVNSGQSTEDIDSDA